jgi:hypothetical protein
MEFGVLLGVRLYRSGHTCFDGVTELLWKRYKKVQVPRAFKQDDCKWTQGALLVPTSSAHTRIVGAKSMVSVRKSTVPSQGHNYCTLYSVQSQIKVERYMTNVHITTITCTRNLYTFNMDQTMTEKFIHNRGIAYLLTRQSILRPEQ